MKYFFGLALFFFFGLNSVNAQSFKDSKTYKNEGSYIAAVATKYVLDFTATGGKENPLAHLTLTDNAGVELADTYFFASNSAALSKAPRYNDKEVLQLHYSIEMYEAFMAQFEGARRVTIQYDKKANKANLHFEMVAGKVSASNKSGASPARTNTRSTRDLKAKNGLAPASKANSINRSVIKKTP